MKEERRKILELLAQGKITADQAEKLMEALEAGRGAGETDPARPRPRWLKIQVEPRPGAASAERVRIKVPLLLLRTGLRIGTLIPVAVQAKVHAALAREGLDVDLSHLTPDAADRLIDALADMTVEVDSDDEQVRVSCC